MPFMNIKCPSCATDGAISFINPDYEGPYRCWKCHELFTIKCKAGQMVAWEPLSTEQLRKQQELEELKTKFKERHLHKN